MDAVAPVRTVCPIPTFASAHFRPDGAVVSERPLGLAAAVAAGGATLAINAAVAGANKMARRDILGGSNCREFDGPGSAYSDSNTKIQAPVFMMPSLNFISMASGIIIPVLLKYKSN